jgi:putative radical SAM enzyme (TIGR03279 family)
MRKPEPAQVESVRPGSPAARVGIAPGDRIVTVNGRAPRDYIEYRYLAAEPEVRLTVANAAARRRRVVIEKPVDEDLGLRFTEDVFDGIRTCGNRCEFCFVSQLPKGLRPALYVRDDDYRLSFLHGNFITLTNLTAADRARIVKYHLSPLYVSVHSTEPEVRAQLFGRETPDPLAEIRWLSARGIAFHAQIVVCRGVNDGVRLERTVRDLSARHPGVVSVGVVPVGLTRYRDAALEPRRVKRPQAKRLVERVHEWQREFLASLGTRLVFAADELYLLANKTIPRRDAYEGFWQLGNGIGGVRQFLDELGRVRPAKVKKPLRVALVTGRAAEELVRTLAAHLELGSQLRATAVGVSNALFGRLVTVAGLLAGQDIARALGRGRYDVVIVPATAVREGEGFIDGMTLSELENAVGAPVMTAGSPLEAARVLRAFARSRRLC